MVIDDSWLWTIGTIYMLIQQEKSEVHILWNLYLDFLLVWSITLASQATYISLQKYYFKNISNIHNM